MTKRLHPGTVLALLVTLLLPAHPASAQFALARYRQDGSLDPAFDGDGKVVTDFPVALDPASDHFWIVGQYARGTSPDCGENGWGLRIGEIAFP